MKPLILLFTCMGLIVFIAPVILWEVAGDVTKMMNDES
jgi:hypothetical protein